MDARKAFADLVNRANYGKERIVITKHGRKVAAVVPVEDLELLERLEDLQDIRDAEKGLKEAKRKGTIPLAQIKKEFGL